MFITLSIFSLTVLIICALIGLYISKDVITLKKYSTLNEILNIAYNILLFITLFLIIVSLTTYALAG